MKICLWGNVADALRGNTPGGAELQIALLAKALVRSGHDVVILDYKTKESFVTSDGVKVVALKGWNEGIRIIRIITHRLPNLYLSLKNQKADVYYCRIRDYRHIFAYWAARKVHAKFILGLADGLDGNSFLNRCKYVYSTNIGGLWWFYNIILTEMVYPFLISRSDLVFTQHEDQKKILSRNNRNSILFPNLIDLNEIPIVTDPVRKDFVYIGSLDKNKGLIELIEIIKRTPMNTYRIIGQPRDKANLELYQRLKSLNNVSLLGRLNHRDTLYQMVNSKALICTSPFEGFPNVFLEAWACGIPVFSLYVNPGNIINKECIGAVANGDIEELIKMMSVIHNSHELSWRAKEYVKKNHFLNAPKIKEIDELFKQLISR